MTRIDDVRRRLDDELPRLAKTHDVPGLSVAVLVDGEIGEGVAGVVNLRSGVQVTPDSLFMIQSITKVWTATLVMQLVDDGLVELDAPVRTYLPGFRTADDDASADITVRHLLTHTGGFEGDLWAPTTAGDDALQRFVEDLVAAAPQRTAPGTMYSYCNAGYGVLGRLVEVLRDATYPAALRRHLAGPLGIEEIAFNADEALAFRTAIGHVRPRPGRAQQPLKVWALLPPSNPAAGNQLAMSARALIAFAAMHLADGRALDGTQVLSAASARTMRTHQVEHAASAGGDDGHGLGWFLGNPPGLVEHGGNAPGVSALLHTVPEQRVAVALLANGDLPSALVRELVDPLLRELAGIEPAPQLATPSADAKVADPRRFVGRYETRAMRHEVTVDGDGRLWCTSTDQHESLSMSTFAGLSLEPEHQELRRIDGDLFALIDSDGVAGRAVEFLGTDRAGRARFLHTGRAAARNDG